MTNIVIFGTRSGCLRATVRRSNYPQKEVTVGSAAYMELPQSIRDIIREKSLQYVVQLTRTCKENFNVDMDRQIHG